MPTKNKIFSFVLRLFLHGSFSLMIYLKTHNYTILTTLKVKKPDLVTSTLT